jgi:hypothetical protein
VLSRGVLLLRRKVQNIIYKVISMSFYFTHALSQVAASFPFDQRYSILAPKNLGKEAAVSSANLNYQGRIRRAAHLGHGPCFPTRRAQAESGFLPQSCLQL